MAARDDTSDSEADGEAAKRLQRDFSPDEEVRKSVGVSVYFWTKLSAASVQHLVYLTTFSRYKRR